MIKAVVFDLDDTLYPEETFVFSGYRAVSEVVLARWGIAIFDELVTAFRAERRGDLFTPVLQRHLPKVDETMVQGLVEAYRGHRPSIEPFPEAEAVLHGAKRHYATGLITDGIAAVQERKLEALGFKPLFDAVVLSGAYGRAHWKPDPLPYELCAQQLALPAPALVYIADNPVKDFITARKLGMKTIRVRRPGTLHCAVEATKRCYARPPQVPRTRRVSRTRPSSVPTLPCVR